MPHKKSLSSLGGRAVLLSARKLQGCHPQHNRSCFPSPYPNLTEVLTWAACIQVVSSRAGRQSDLPFGRDGGSQEE